MISQSLVHHPSLDHYLRFVATTTGRDKILRTLQYFARFYLWSLIRSGVPPDRAAPWTTLKKQLGLARKLLRIGKFLEHLKAAALAADSKSLTPFLRFATLGRQLSYAAYLTLDAITVPGAAGFGLYTHSTADVLQRRAYTCWAAGILFSLSAQLYTLRRLTRREAKVDRKDGEGVVELKRIARCVAPPPWLARIRLLPVVDQLLTFFTSSDRSASQLQLVCDLCDLAVPSSALGWVRFDDGFVGLTGLLSSVIGLHVQWKKTA